MSPALPITEDTPPDMLAGAMDLHVVLPNGRDMKMSVERSTPMMDLLVQITTANKMSPGGHVIQAFGERGILPYKPSTPIGALDTWSIHIVSKKHATKSLPRQSTVYQNTPFEQTFRLQVNLPRNQLYVSRVSYKTRLENILREVCEEKNLDASKYCFIHPEKLDEVLDLSKTFLDYKIQRVTLCSKNNIRPIGLSSVDIMALKRCDQGNQSMNRYYASHSYDGSISSGSMEGRSLSPVRSDESSMSPPIPKTNPNSILNRPPRKRRPAPKPPSTNQNDQHSKHGCESLTISHSRNSSDSSGYHESSVLSETLESNTNSLGCSLPRRSKLPSDNSHEFRRINRNGVIGGHSVINGKVINNLSRSLSNLAVIGNKKASTLSNAMKHKPISASSMSLSSAGRKKKAPAPPPPASSKSLLCLKEEESVDSSIEFRPQTPKIVNISCSTMSNQTGVTLDSNNVYRNFESSSCKDPLNILSHSSTNIRAPELNTVDDVDSTAINDMHESKYPDYHKKNVSASTATVEKEFTLDEEIDRIFQDATKDYESPRTSSLSSPTMKSANFKRTTLTEEEKCFNQNCKVPTQLSPEHLDNAAIAESGFPKINSNLEMKSSTSKEATKSRRTATEEPKFLHMDRKNENISKNGSDRFTKINDQSTCDRMSETNESGSHTQMTNDEVEEFRCWSTKIDTRVREMSGTLSHNNFGFVCTNHPSTNDSGLGSDDSIPSVSEGKGLLDELPVYERKLTDMKEKQKRVSTLDNFTITTYHNSKPTEIFHDDSVKTSKTTQIAASNRGFVSGSTSCKLNGLSRHSSFSVEKSPGSIIKRSKSHISLLSGNFIKFNRLVNKLNQTELSDCDETMINTNCKGNNDDQRPKYSSNLIVNRQKAGQAFTDDGLPLRRTISEISLCKDSNKEVEESVELPGQYLKQDDCSKIETEDGSSRINSELQSIQVLKGILPQIKQKHHVYESSHEFESKVTLKKSAIETSSAIVNPLNTMKSSMFTNPVPPTINLQSWNDRPKRHVSIKTDRDYVFGNVQNTVVKDRNSVENEEENLDSRIPVVRAVEFKKPSLRPKLESYSKLENSKQCVDQKVRPVSCYLFGENTINSVCNERNDRSYTPSNRKFVEDKPHQKQHNYTFKVYKDKLLENEKSSSKLLHYFQDEKCDHKVLYNGNSDCHFRTECPQSEGKENITTGFEIGSLDKKNSSGFKLNKSHTPIKSTEVSNGAFIPATLSMPKKGLSYSQKVNRKSLGKDENPRDMLLSSIKNFNRENLRKLRVK